MRTRETSRDKPVEFFSAFTSDHESWLVSLDLRGRQPGHETVDSAAQDLAQRGIAADLKNQEHTVVITVGVHDDDLLRHILVFSSYCDRVEKEAMTMPTREIPRKKWVEFFQTFTSEHEGWLVSLGLRGRQPGHETADIAARDLPLRGIAVDLKDQEHTVVITVGARDDDLLRHIVSEVSQVRLTRTKEGVDSALQIEGANSQTTTLKLSVPVPAQA